MDGKEIGRKAKLRDDPQFLFHQITGTGRLALRITALQSFFSQALKAVLRRLYGRYLIGVFITQFAQTKAAPRGDLQCATQGGWMVARSRSCRHNPRARPLGQDSTPPSWRGACPKLAIASGVGRRFYHVATPPNQPSYRATQDDNLQLASAPPHRRGSPNVAVHVKNAHHPRGLRDGCATTLRLRDAVFHRTFQAPNVPDLFLISSHLCRVESLAKEGANVAINYFASSEGADSAVAEITAAGGKAFALQGDLNTQEGVDALVSKAVSEFGGVDILVNNTGGLIARKTISEMSLEHWNAVMDLNLTSTFLMVKACLKHMKAGAIVNLASQAGRDGGGPGAIAYATSKGAVMTMTRGLAKELGPEIRVNALCPGMIDTDFHNIFTKPEVRTMVENAAPAKRQGSPLDVANLVLFLASDDGAFITGANWPSVTMRLKASNKLWAELNSAELIRPCYPQSSRAKRNEGHKMKVYPIVETGENVTRQVLSDDPSLMTVEFAFSKAGAIGALHNHPHVQSTYVAEGQFRFTVGDDTFEVGPGDSFVIPSGATHGCTCLKPGRLVDCFTPRRDDFL
ncbi:3-oxoacyl-[acyl-carrier-protein] reductase [Nymphon striatum]|nr:3-oxoacyl-[acyl-carrier-protein] reductase [Nymphon striatum]